jgi:signal transduction histidine kinase
MLVGAVALLGVIVLAGAAIGFLLAHAVGATGSAKAPAVMVVVVLGFVAFGGAAIAYRRLGPPFGDLLAAARRVGQGDYTARTEPRGPRELRRLMGTFNEMVDGLEVSEAERRRFLADVTHELRTPLTVLQSEIEAQLDGIHPRDDAHLAMLLDETKVLGRLVDDLHTLALLGAGRLTLHPEATDAAELVDDAVTSVSALAGEHHVTLNQAADPGLPTLQVDPTRIRQVLVNLLTNALRHTPEGGEVSVAARAADGAPEPAVRFFVADSGPGIPADELPRVFDPFQKSADSGGSGLGLAIARDLVRAHGGEIEAVNGPTGATVTFSLPVAPSEDAARRGA